MHGAMIAVHTAHAAATAKAKVLDAFRIRGATAPERARPIAELGLQDDDRSLAAFIAAGVIRGVDSRGRLTVLGDAVNRTVGYYLDEAAYVASRDAHRVSPVVAGTIAIVVSTLLVLLMLILVLRR